MARVTELRKADIDTDRKQNEQGQPDPFYSVRNQQELSDRINEIENGTAEFITKTMAELETMANE